MPFILFRTVINKNIFFAPLNGRTSSSTTIEGVWNVLESNLRILQDERVQHILSLFADVIHASNILGMDNREVITELSNKLEDTFTRKEVIKVVDELLKIITESRNKGGVINLTDLGKFAIKQQPPRRYYNVHTDQIEYSTTKKQ